VADMGTDIEVPLNNGGITVVIRVQNSYK